MNIDQLNQEVNEWIYSAPKKEEILRRAYSAERFGTYFAEFGKLLDAGNLTGNSRQEIISLFDTANRFGVYKLSIVDYLSTCDDLTEFVLGTLLTQFGRYTVSKYGIVFPEFNIYAPYSTTHLQTLSEFVALYFS